LPHKKTRSRVKAIKKKKKRKIRLLVKRGNTRKRGKESKCLETH